MTAQFPTDSPQIHPTQPQVHPTPTGQENFRRLPFWRLLVPLLFQGALILAVPAQDAYTVVTGKQVTLQTAPVDPYDFLRGYSQTLSYTISRTEQLKSLPGGTWFEQQEGTPGHFYVVLEAPAQTGTIPPQPWKPVRVSGDRPTNLTAQQIALQGWYDGWGWISYGLETYYMPADQRDQLNMQIGQLQQEPQAFVVDVKVDAQGNAVPVSLWVRDRNYQF